MIKRGFIALVLRMLERVDLDGVMGLLLSMPELVA